MTKRAQLADGTILEFPADTPDEVMDKVVRQHISGQAAPQAAPPVAAQAEPIVEAPQPMVGSALNPAAPVWNPQTGQQDSTANYTPPHKNSGLYDAKGNPLPADWEGEAFDENGEFVLMGTVTDDAPWPTDNVANNAMETLGAVGGSMFRGLAALPDLALDARDLIFPNMAAGTDRSRFSDIPDMLGTKRPNSPGVEFAGNVLGGMVIPGPKAGPKPMNALAPQATKNGDDAVNALADPRAVVQAGKREGVRVMTSDVKPPRTFMGKAIRNTGERIPIVGTGGMRAGQQEQRIAATRRLADEFGAGTTLAEAGDDVAKDFAATRGAAVQGFTKAKKSVIESIPGVAPATNTLKAIDDKIAELEARGSPTALEVVAELKKLRPSFEGKTLAQLEAMRADELGAFFKGDSMARIKDVGEKAMQSIYKPLNDDMGAFIKEKGGTQQFIKWKNANTRLASMAKELDTASFRGALNKAETTPEAAAKLIFSKTPSDVRRLYRNLSPAGRVKAQAAMFLKVAEDATTDGIISPDKFKNGIEALDNATGIFMSPADKARVDGFTRLMSATKRAAEAGVMTNSGQQTVPALMGAAAYAMPWKVGGFALVTRLYESAPVRDALLRIGRAKPGSPQEAKAIGYAEKLISRHITKAAPLVDRVGEAAAQSPVARAAAGDEND